MMKDKAFIKRAKEYSLNEAFYKLYQRAGRQDVITKIHTEVIRGLAV